MSKNSKNSVKEPAEERTPAPQPKALNQTAIDPMYIGRLAGTLLGICLVTALLLGAVNQVTKPRIDAAQKAKTEAAMAQVLPADAYEKVDTDAPGVTALYRVRHQAQRDEKHRHQGCLRSDGAGPVHRHEPRRRRHHRQRRDQPL